MSDLESLETTAKDLLDFAKQRGEDLSPTCHNAAFFGEGRYIMVWRNAGKVHYNMQGKISTLPERYKASASAFHGMWTEVGTLTDLEAAFEFLKAWLIDRKEIDDLPQRQVRREGIG